MIVIGIFRSIRLIVIQPFAASETVEYEAVTGIKGTVIAPTDKEGTLVHPVIGQPGPRAVRQGARLRYPPDGE